MAVMSEQQRLEGGDDFMRNIPFGISYVVLKPNVRAAYDAADSWANDNAASYNSALPANFRNNATAAEKARLLVMVLNKRYDLGL